jgi:hypothetical protein
VASGTDWFVSWADVPSVSRLADGTLVAQWLKNVDPSIEAYDLRLSTSHDNGRTWTTPFSPSPRQDAHAARLRVAVRLAGPRNPDSGVCGSTAATRS